MPPIGLLRRSVHGTLQPLIVKSCRYASTSAVSENSGKARRAATWGLGALAVGGAAVYWTLQAPVQVKEPSKPAFTGQGFFNLTLQSVEDISHNTKKFRFALPEEDQVSGLQTASCLLTRFKDSNTEKAVIRPYTPISDEDEQGHVDLLVKKYPSGVMSSHFHEMTPGQSLEFKGPISKYPWSPNMHSHVTMIAGGTGIAPMYQLVRTIFKNPEEKTKVTLVYGNVTEDDILLRKELLELENTYPQRFRVFYVLDNPPKSWLGEKGYISKNLLKTVLPEPKEENIKIFVCGPSPMYKSISGMKKSASDQGNLDGSILEELGYSKDQVFKF